MINASISKRLFPPELELKLVAPTTSGCFIFITKSKPINNTITVSYEK